MVGSAWGPGACALSVLAVTACASYAPDMGRYSELPEPVRLEDTITSEDVVLRDPDSEQLVDDWLMRNAGG